MSPHVSQERHCRESHDFLAAAWIPSAPAAALPHDEEGWHQHDVDEMLLILDGQAFVTVGAESAFLCAGDLACVPAGVTHALRPAASADRLVVLSRRV